MGRIYSVAFSGDGHNSAEDLFGIYAGSLAICIREIGLGAYNYGAIEDADLQVWRRGGTITPGSGGGVPTPVALRSTDPAASFIAHTNDTTHQEVLCKNLG